MKLSQMSVRSRWRSSPTLGLAGALLLVVGLFVASGASAEDAPPECAASGPSLQEAKSNYSDSCALPRIDCDEINDVWYCSSRVIGRAAPGGVTADDVGASGIGSNSTIVVTTTTVSQSSTTQTSTPPTTTPQTSTSLTLPPTTEETTTTVTPGTNPPGECGLVVVEAETMALIGDWRVAKDLAASGGAYATWEGLSPSANNNSPADAVTTPFEIEKPGSYRFTWAMRQPDGVDSDKANDSWLNFPDASRFGPVAGGEYPGFIKVYGNSLGRFSYSATADVNHNKSSIAVDFDAAGTYTMQIAGRSHGHQIDRIVIHHSSISKADAIAGNGTDCGGATTTTAPATTTTIPVTTTTADPGTNGCDGNATGQVNLSQDLISLHYDHAPDRDDGHATAAGKEVAARVGFEPWVIGGAYGADNGNSYRDESELVMDAVWGQGRWINADQDWNLAVQRTADRWQETLDDCGDVWIAEGGQSDLSADVVRELRRRQPTLDTKDRIHLVQHSGWNEDKALDADLTYVKSNTDYLKIGDGNGGGNGTADLNDQNYNGPFIDTALNGANAAGWRAAFNYYPPRTERLDFSDTVELLRILNIGTDQVNNIEGFADRFMR